MGSGSRKGEQVWNLNSEEGGERAPLKRAQLALGSGPSALSFFRFGGLGWPTQKSGARIQSSPSSRALRPERLATPHYKPILHTQVTACLGVKVRSGRGAPREGRGSLGRKASQARLGAGALFRRHPVASAPEPAGTAPSLRPWRTAHLTLNGAPPTSSLLGRLGRGDPAIGQARPRRPRLPPRPSSRPPVLWTAAWRPSSPPGPRPLEQMLPSCGRGADARARALLASASSRWARESERRKRKGGRGRGVEEGREEEEEEVAARSRLASRPRRGRGERGARAHARVLARSIHPPVAARARAPGSRRTPRPGEAGWSGGRGEGRADGARTARGRGEVRRRRRRRDEKGGEGAMAAR